MSENDESDPSDQDLTEQSPCNYTGSFVHSMQTKKTSVHDKKK